MFQAGLFALIIFVFARPLDFIPALRGLPFLYIFFVLALAGFIVSVATGRVRLVSSPQLPWVAFFLFWCVLSLAFWDSGALVASTFPLLISIAVYYLIGYGTQTPKAFRRLVMVLMACSVWISFVCTHMAYQPRECVADVIDEEYDGELVQGESDGRSCDHDADCFEEGVWTVRFRCEYIGLFDLTSTQGRVRYAGVLHDPNETSMAVCLGLPLILGLRTRRRTWLTAALLAVAVLLAMATVVYTQSRGGQLVFLAVFGVYFLRRYGIKGALVLAAGALPVLLLGGRSDTDGSSLERLECQFEGLQMFVQSPLFGVGYSRFTEYNPLTAHNSFVLAPAELGLPGMLAWSVAMYFSWKVPISALGWASRFEPEPGAGFSAEEIESWGISLLAIQVGIAVGTFFLSFNYHFVLWIHFGLVAAFYTTLRRIEPDYSVRIRPWEVAAVLVAHGALLVAVRLVIRLKLGF